MKKLKVPIVNKSRHPMPEYATPQSAGLDVRANIDEDIVLEPLCRKLIPTGLYMALPVGCEAQVRPRSGLALKHGVTVLNSPGTVDADYRGEIGVVLINFGNMPFTIKDGERIAQLVIAKHEHVVFDSVDVLDETERGTGGYYSTQKPISNTKKTINIWNCQLFMLFLRPETEESVIVTY